MGEHTVAGGIVSQVAHLGGVGIEVVQLPLVVEHLSAPGHCVGARGGQLTYMGFGPARRVVEGADQFPHVACATGCLVIVDPPHHGLHVRRHRPGHGDHEVGRWIVDVHDPSGNGSAVVTLEDVVTGLQVDRAVGVKAAVDQWPQARTGQRVHFAEAFGECGSSCGDVDASGVEQRGQQVHVRRRGVVDGGAPSRCLALGIETHDGQRNPHCLVVQGEPLLVHPAVGTQHLAVI